MTDYYFDEALFKKNFGVKEDSPENTFRISRHSNDNCFKLFPYKAAISGASPIVYDLRDCISEFFRNALGITAGSVEFDQLCNNLIDTVVIEENEDIEMFKEIIASMFFRNKNFYAYNIGLYPYQTVNDNKSSGQIAKFLYCILGLDNTDKENIKSAIDRHSFNVLERLVVDSIETHSNENTTNEEKYYQVIRSVQKQFKIDFAFMLSSGMTSSDDIANILSFYYFFYVSQTCIALDQFGNGDRQNIQPLYFALDWEKVSKNRKCCLEGWTELQNSISHMFSHAVTLEIINQNSNKMLDYIDLRSISVFGEENDIKLSSEIKKAENTYVSYVGDCPKIRYLPEENGYNRTDAAIRHLFRCVSTQFAETSRHSASQRYSNKFSDFCKKRFIKNRRKSGLTLNLTEEDIIFLTKLAIQHDDKIRLNDLYKEYEYRGVYLDLTSKGLLQEFFTRLNLIDKKSDSGDAQYVKRIL